MGLIKFILMLPITIIRWILSPVFLVLKLIIGGIMIVGLIYVYIDRDNLKTEVEKQVIEQTKSISLDDLKKLNDEFIK